MDEFLKRLDEIRKRAAELRGQDLTDEVIAEIKALADEKAEIESKVEALTSVEALAAEQDGEDEQEAPAEGEDSSEPEAPAETPAEEPAEEALAASAGVVEAPADDEPIVQQSVFIASAASGLPQAGSQVDRTDLMDVFRRSATAPEGSAIYGQISARNGGALVSSRSSKIENTKTLIAAAPGDAFTAAACFCDQTDRVREILTPLEAGRPFADLFGKVDINGRFTYVRGLALSVVDAGVNKWTCVEQEDVDYEDSGTWKPCVDLPCQPDVEVEPYAIYACANVTVFQQVSSPELIDNFLYTIAVNYDRTAEILLLDEFVSTSNVFTYTLADKGLLHTLTQILGSLPAVAGYGNRNHWSGYTMALGPGLLDALVADEHLRGFTGHRTREEIIAALRQLGVGNVVELLDVDTAAIGAYTAAIAALPALGNPGAAYVLGTNNVATYPVYLVPTEAYRMGQRSVVDAGWLRDGTLVRQNAVRYFFENMEFLEKMVQVPSFTLRITGCPNGGTAALTEPIACS